MITTAKEAREIMLRTNAMRQQQWAEEQFINILFLIEQKSRLGYVGLDLQNPISEVLMDKLQAAGFTVKEKNEYFNGSGFTVNIQWL